MATIRNSEDGTKIFFDSSEFKQILEEAPWYRTRIALRLQARSSPRGGFVVSIKPEDLFIDSGLPFVRIKESKDTSDNGGGGEHRESWVPKKLYDRVLQYCRYNDIEDDEHIIDIKYDQYKNDLIEIGEEMAEKTGDGFWKDLRTHDPRRYYCTNMVQHHNVEKTVVMDMGGWSSLRAMRPYLMAKQPDQIRDELARKNMLNNIDAKPDAHASTPYRSARVEQLHDKLDVVAESLSDDGDISNIMAKLNETSWKEYLPDVGNHYIECETPPKKEDEDDYLPHHGGDRNSGDSRLSDFQIGQKATVPGLGTIGTSAELLTLRLKDEFYEMFEPEQYSFPTAKRAAVGIPALILTMLMGGFLMASTGVHATADGLVVPEGQLLPLVLGCIIAVTTMLIADFRERYGTDRWAHGL